MNPYLPQAAEIMEIKRLSKDVKSFIVRFTDKEAMHSFKFMVGQFVMVSLWGVGEAPISITSSPHEENYLELCIKDTGRLTHYIHQLTDGDRIGIRGPYGNHFPVERLTGKDLLLAAGGIGIAPIRSVAAEVIRNRDLYNKVTIIYGARTPSDLIYSEELGKTCVENNVRLLLTVDNGDGSWKGKTGFVSELCSELHLSPTIASALICGPHLMMEAVTGRLISMGFQEDQIYLSLERQMRCGVGKCGHCYVNGKYVCEDGPVFSYSEIRRFL